MTKNTPSTTEDLGPISPRAKSGTASTTELWEQSEELIPRMEKKAALLEDDLLRKQVIRLGFLLDSLHTRFERMEQERDEARGWLRFIAETQHRLLEAIQIEVTDEEWAAFAEAVGFDQEKIP